MKFKPIRFVFKILDLIFQHLDMKRFTILPLLALVVFLSSCKKDNTLDEGPDIIFTTAIDGYTVTFNNTTAGATSYKWDFGDGATSTDKSPVHTYAGKGKYVPTLTITADNGRSYEGSTVLRLTKGSAVKLTDNSFADWDTVSNGISYPTGYFRNVKLDYDAENIYFYMELQSTVAAGDIFDFYLDTDNNPGTGLITWVSTGGGNDVLIEGAMLANWFDVFYHTGAQTAFSFNPQTISDFYSIGTTQEVGGILKLEGKIVRSKIKNLTGKGLKFATTSTKNDWSVTLGVFPAAGTPALFLDMSE